MPSAFYDEPYEIPRAAGPQPNASYRSVGHGPLPLVAGIAREDNILTLSNPECATGPRLRCIAPAAETGDILLYETTPGPNDVAQCVKQNVPCSPMRYWDDALRRQEETNAAFLGRVHHRQPSLPIEILSLPAKPRVLIASGRDGRRIYVGVNDAFLIPRLGQERPLFVVVSG